MRTRVRKRFAITSLLFAWLCANGALLDAVQVFAWGKMFAGYAQSMPLTEALRETFDPLNRCEICNGVATAKDEAAKQHPQATEQAAAKLILALDTPTPLFLLQPDRDWPATLARISPSHVEAVPVPPPRALS